MHLCGLAFHQDRRGAEVKPDMRGAVNAIRARKAQERADGNAAAADRAGNLVGLTAPVTNGPDIVGWMRPAPGTIKGQQHQCISCQPVLPKGPGWKEVQRHWLAATMPCSVCGTKLERVQAIAQPCTETNGNEK